MKCSHYGAAILAVSAAFFLPPQALAQIGLNVVIGSAPPPPRLESVPLARPGYVWTPGYWNWEGQRHVWVAGQWQAERPGYQYQGPEWVRADGGWRLNQGRWVAFEAGGPDYRAPAPRYGYRDDYVRVAPPPPRHEWTPRPRHGYVWAQGHWEWRDQRHVWMPGMWIAERPGHDYVAASWVRRDGHWYLEPGHWTRRGEWADSDHDGIPNRYDRDRDNDGVVNWHDRDRDGDGVPNRFDQHPDNPRRD